EFAPWLRNFGLNLFVQGLSGRPYTPISYNGSATGAPNSKNALFQMTTDMRVDRWFDMGGKKRLGISLTALNMFDHHLISIIDPRTGAGRVWGEGSYDYTNPYTNAYDKNNPNGNQYVYTSDILNPSNYGPGAQWRLAVDYDF